MNLPRTVKQYQAICQMFAQAVGISKHHPFEEVGFLAHALDELMVSLHAVNSASHLFYLYYFLAHERFE